MGDYQFTETQDWFSGHIPTWRSLFPLVTAQSPRIIEIGSWEGRSAVFLLENLCTNGGEIVCIDHFDLMRTSEGQERYRKVDHNLTRTGKSFRIVADFSIPGLYSLLHEEASSSTPGFDWIYIDGSHESDDTFLDGELAWRLARKGAIVIFDDYRWNQEPDDSRHHPKRGIDCFLALHTGEYDTLSSSEQYQMVIRKRTEMRIGFLPKEMEIKDVQAAFGYGMHIALAVDSSYALPAAVTIRSTVQITPGRITFHIIDCGLTEGDVTKLQKTASIRSDVTLVKHTPPDHGLSGVLGSVWAKIDMLKVLNLERVLYLDADTLVLKDLTPLWKNNLGGKTLAAAPDVGHPMGHEGVGRFSYFNAGVLLVDLKLARARCSQLRSLVETQKDSEYKDQDLLNTHFKDEWAPLSLEWNAQGLGTYAENATPERLQLSLSQLQDPAIVHFTGPVHPSMAIVLNPWVQPYTAKPWGYAGAPGHPYTEAWWALVEQTAWKGWRSSEDYQRICSEAEVVVVETASKELQKRASEGREV